MKGMTSRIEAMYEAISKLKKLEQTADIEEEVTRLEERVQILEKEAETLHEPWDKVVLARKLDRPRGKFYIEQMTTDFIECHGDRSYADDRAIIGGICKINNHVVTLIIQNKGNNSKDNIERNFGMPHPEGYRKALRLMKQAEKFKRPVVCLIDTPGAYCGIGAEERGQGEAIARNLMEMSRLRTPIIAGVIGEGGSGGALALGVADKVFMQQNAIYSVLSPEGFASILWKDSSRAQEAASKMKITAQDLLEYQIIDDIVKEPIGGAHKNSLESALLLKEYIVSQLDLLKTMSIESLLEQRYERFRKYGVYSEKNI